MASEDHRRLLELLEVVAEADLDVLEVEAESFTLSLRRNGAAPEPAVGPRVRPAEEPAVPHAEAQPPEPATTAGSGEVPAGCVAVQASMVGVFYRSPEPGAEPFVDVGTTVAAGATMGLIEVMKLFNAVSSPVDGVVESVVAADRDLVEYGQTLFVVRTGS